MGYVEQISWKAGDTSVDLATSRMRCTPRALAHRCRTKEVKNVARYQFGKVAHAKVYSIWRVGRVRLSLNMTPVGRRLDRVALAWRLPSMCGQLPTPHAYGPGALLGVWACPAPTPNKLVAGHLVNPGFFFQNCKLLNNHTMERISERAV
jgi:hypothetical protein